MILLLGGTSEGSAIGDLLKSMQLPFVMTVTSAYGAEMAQRHQEELIQCHFSEETIEAFIDQHRIHLVLDATHPHAALISDLAQRVANRQEVDYMRFERPRSNCVPNEHLHVVRSPQEAATLAPQLGERILITGSKHLALYAAALGPKRLFVRVLPSPEVLTEVLSLGIPADHIIAMKGPFTEALNQALFEAFQIEVLITKESGQTGGFQEKVASAMASGVRSIVIQRPAITYSQRVQSLEALEAWLRDWPLKGESNES